MRLEARRPRRDFDRVLGEYGIAADERHLRFESLGLFTIGTHKPGHFATLHITHAAYRAAERV